MKISLVNRSNPVIRIRIRIQPPSRENVIVNVHELNLDPVRTCPDPVAPCALLLRLRDDPGPEPEPADNTPVCKNLDTPQDESKMPADGMDAVAGTGFGFNGKRAKRGFRTLVCRFFNARRSFEFRVSIFEFRFSSLDFRISTGK